MGQAVKIQVRNPDRTVLKVVTGTQVGDPAERLRKDGEAPGSKPDTFAEWQALHPNYPLAQLREPDAKGRQYIYIPNKMGYRDVSGTCDGGEALSLCAARELFEEIGLDLRATPARLVAGGPGQPFRVDATADECREITQLLTSRIASRRGEIFAFRWEQPRGGRRKTKRTRRGKK